MKQKEKSYIIFLYLTAFLLFSIIISSAELAATERNVLSPGVHYAYVTNYNSNNVSIIDTDTNIVTATLPVGKGSIGVAVIQNGTRAFVTNNRDNTISVIDTIANTIVKIPVGNGPVGIAVTLDGKKVYVTNSGSNTVSVFVINMIGLYTTGKTPLNVGTNPFGVVVTPDGKKVYVTNKGISTTSVIDTSNNSVAATVNVGSGPTGVAVSPDGKKVYVTNYNSSTVSVIDTATNIVTTTVNVGKGPCGIAVHPAGTKVYVANEGSSNVSVIDASQNKVTATVNVGNDPGGVAVTPDGKKVFVADWKSNKVFVIDTAINIIITTLNVENNPVAFGQFAGTRGPRPLYDLVLFWFLYFVINAILCSLFAISVIITVFFFTKIVRKKSFEQNYSELNLIDSPYCELNPKNTSKGRRISVINDIHSCLQKNIFEELLFLNLKCNGIQYFPYYHYFFLLLVAIIFLLIGVFISYYNRYAINDYFSTNYLFFLLAPIPIILFPIFIFGVISRKVGTGKTSWKKLGIRLFSNMVEIILIIVLSYTIFYIVISTFFSWNPNLTNFLPQNGYFNYPINFFTYFSEFNFTSLEGNQLSLAGFYLSLAVGGTVVLSIVDRYFKEEDSLRKILLENSEIFNKLYSKSLNLNLSDIISFDCTSKNFRSLNIKKIINLNNNPINNFANLLSQIQTELKCAEIENRRLAIDIYKYFIQLVISTYIIGIITIFIPERFTTYLFWIFIFDSVLFGALIYIIYRNFRWQLTYN